MRITWRRYEVLLPVKFNDGRQVPDELLAEAVIEVRVHFGAVRFDCQRSEGQWQQEGKLYFDELSCLVVDMPDTAKNRKWMKQFKEKWKERLGQLELWMVSYRIDLE